MSNGVLYKAADGSWRQTKRRAGISRLYTLQPRERWALLNDDRVLVVHPNRPPRSSTRMGAWSRTPRYVEGPPPRPLPTRPRIEAATEVMIVVPDRGRRPEKCS